MNTASVFSIMSSGRHGPRCYSLMGPTPGDKDMGHKEAIKDWMMGKINPYWVFGDTVPYWWMHYYREGILCCAQGEGRVDEMERLMGDICMWFIRNPSAILREVNIRQESTDAK